MIFVFAFDAICVLISCLYIQIKRAENIEGLSFWDRLKPVNYKYIIWYIVTLFFCTSAALMLLFYYNSDFIYISKRVFCLQ